MAFVNTALNTWRLEQTSWRVQYRWHISRALTYLWGGGTVMILKKNSHPCAVGSNHILLVFLVFSPALTNSNTWKRMIIFFTRRLKKLVSDWRSKDYSSGISSKTTSFIYLIGNIGNADWSLDLTLEPIRKYLTIVSWDNKDRRLQ